MKFPLLLDTCAVIWMVEDQLSPEVAEMMGCRHREGEPTFLSPITAWELGLLFSKGRLRSPVSPVEYFHRLASLPTVRLTTLSPELMIMSSFLPGPAPRDPADRIIAATARELGFTVMTRDRSLLDYGKAGYLQVTEC